MKTIATLTALSLLIIGQAYSQSESEKAKQKKTSTESDSYTFDLSDKVIRKEVTFRNRYGITLAADLYLPRNSEGKILPALVIGGPFGAVKEQSSGLYAQNMAERGFAALAFDPSYIGESCGEP